MRGQTVTDEIGIRDRQTHVPFEAATSLSDLREELLHVRRRIVAPAVLVEPRAGDVTVKAILESAPASNCPTRRLHDPPENSSATPGCVSPLFVRSANAPPRVLSPNSGLDPGMSVMVSIAACGIRSQADDIAEGGVYSDTILVDRETLRRAEQRGGGKAPVVDVGLVRIALDVVDVDARHPEFQLLRDIGRGRLLELAPTDDLDVRRQLVSGYANAGDRCRGDHVDGWRGDWCALLSCRRGRQRSEHAGHHPSRAGSPRFFLVVHVSSLRACADRADGATAIQGKRTRARRAP